LAFGTLEWSILPKREESSKQTPKVGESNNSRNIVYHNLLGLFDQIFLPKLIYSPTKETTMTTPIVTLTMFVLPIMTLPVANVLHIQLPIYHDNDDPSFHLQQLTKICVTN